MKRLFLALLGAATLAAAAAATAAAPTVTLSADKKTIIYGGTVTLSGQISPARANEKVTITTTPETGTARSTVVSTQNDGSFTLDVKPRIQTQAQATYKQGSQTATSQPLVIFVRPRVGLRKYGVGRFAVSVVAIRSFVGKYVWVTRWDSRRRQWRNIKRVYLVRYVKSSGASTAAFRLRLTRRTKLRVFLPTTQARPGYVFGFSNFIFASP
jgi:hypothetical protein